MAMQGVVDAHPVNGEKLLLTELTVCKHLLTLVAYLDVEDAIAEALAQCVEHLSENLAALFDVGRIDSFAEQSAVHEEIRRQPRCAVAHDSQQVSHHLSAIVFGNHHIRLLTGCLPRQSEELRTVEEVRVIEWRQLFFAGDDVGFQLVHSAKLRNNYHRPIDNRFFFVILHQIII